MDKWPVANCFKELKKARDSSSSAQKWDKSHIPISTDLSSHTLHVGPQALAAPRQKEMKRFPQGTHKW